MSSVLVGLETSGPVASVALSVAGRVVARRTLGEQGRHAARLLPALDEVLTEGRIRRGDLTGVVVGTGPGSFTGVRVAATAGKGIAHSLRIPLHAVSSLLAAALAERVPPPTWEGWPTPVATGEALPVPEGRERVVLFDARGDRLFHAAYVLRDGGIEVLDPPSFRRLPELLADRARAPAPHCGSGAIRHGDALRTDGRVVLPPPYGLPTADGLLLHMASPAAPEPLEHPFEWEPDYLRETGAVRSNPG